MPAPNSHGAEMRALQKHADDQGPDAAPMGGGAAPAEEHPSSERLRASLDAILEARGLSASGWCIMAGLPESTLRNFLKKRSDTLTYATLWSLAKAISEPVSTLLGESQQKTSSQPTLVYLVSIDFPREGGR